MLKTNQSGIKRRIALCSAIVGALLCMKPVAAQEVVGVMHAPLRSLDPIITTAYIVRNFGYMVYDTLLSEDEEGAVQPQMLSHWDVSDDGTTYTFHLREGLKWHDGNPVTSEDIIASISRWSKLDKAGQIMASLLTDMSVIDDQRFEMVFSESTDIALRAMAKPSAVPALMMPKRLANTPTDEPLREAIGSGPFRFVSEEYRPGVEAVFEKNPDYVPRSEPANGMSGGKVVHIDRMKWVTMPDTMTAINALNNKEIDFIEQVPHDLLPLLENNTDIDIAVLPTQGGQTEMRFNFLHPPFDNKLLRQAAMLAVAQEDVLQAQIGHADYHQTCAAVFGCSSIYASDSKADSVVNADLDKARALLEEANYDGTPVVILQPTDLHIVGSVLPVIAQGLRDAGFNVDLQTMDWQTVVTRRASRDAPADGGWNIFSTFTVVPDIRDPLSFMGVAANGDGAWFGWPDIPAIEERRAQFARTADEEELQKLAEEIHDLVVDEGVLIPLGEFAVVRATSNKLSNMLDTPVPVFWNMQKE